MDLVFIRNQIELKLIEAQSLNSLYIEGIKKELNKFDKVVTPTMSKEIEGLLSELEQCSSNIGNIHDNFDLAVTRLTIIYQELVPKFNDYIEDYRKSMTSASDGISITRIPLTWSTFAESAGYSKEKMILDIAFKPVVSIGIRMYHPGLLISC